jgi:microsomal dipeptidase-like Zn-dependent dipeptidase
LLAVASLWPPRTWTSLEARVLRQAAALDRLARESDGRFVEVRSRADLERLLARHAADHRVVGGLLDIEGAHALGDGLAALDRVEAAGVRMIGLAHFYDNAFAGSAHGVAKKGLTDLGRTLVREMERRGIVVDLAHSSPATIADVLAMATRPLVASHTGVRGTCDNARNLSDEQLRGVARLGGVVGIGFWETAACGLAPADVARAVKYAVDLIGDDHVGLGSDFDGAVTTGFDAAGLPGLTQALVDAGIPEASLPKILGGNAIRVLRAVLPAA